jgi:hypothetical protein
MIQRSGLVTAGSEIAGISAPLSLAYWETLRQAAEAFELMKFTLMAIYRRPPTNQNR